MNLLIKQLPPPFFFLKPSPEHTRLKHHLPLNTRRQITANKPRPHSSKCTTFDINKYRYILWYCSCHSNATAQYLRIIGDPRRDLKGLHIIGDLDDAHDITQHNRATGSSIKSGTTSLFHRPIINRSESNPRRFPGQSAAQDGLTRLQQHRTLKRLSG